MIDPKVCSKLRLRNKFDTTKTATERPTVSPYATNIAPKKKEGSIIYFKLQLGQFS